MDRYLPTGLQWAISEGDQWEAVSKPCLINCKSHNQSLTVTISWQVFSDSLLVLFSGVCAYNGIHKLKFPGTWHMLQIVQQWQTHTQLYVSGPNLFKAVFSVQADSSQMLWEVHHCYSIEREGVVLWQFSVAKNLTSPLIVSSLIEALTYCQPLTVSVTHSFNVILLTFHILHL